jgi:hypothetical protein
VSLAHQLHECQEARESLNQDNRALQVQVQDLITQGNPAPGNGESSNAELVVTLNGKIAQLEAGATVAAAAFAEREAKYALGCAAVDDFVDSIEEYYEDAEDQPTVPARMACVSKTFKKLIVQTKSDKQWAATAKATNKKINSELAAEKGMRTQLDFDKTNLINAYRLLRAEFIETTKKKPSTKRPLETNEYISEEELERRGEHVFEQTVKKPSTTRMQSAKNGPRYALYH